ncbi:hypothetical protein POTOM_033261 [Populus tomentosa]|uniref:Matrin-type domain-containing protein n=1 Tax=Populus tomentosa TaxID=118781 RepID=A0A8X8CQR2_POPTO|nr:hypothetical protein POTOM_033261 [Populus tomentosa]
MCSVESARKAETEKEGEDSGFVVVIEVEEGGLVEVGRDLFQVEEVERQGDKGWKVGVVWLRSGVFSSGIIISANDSGEITIDLITSMGWHWFGLRCNCFVNYWVSQGNKWCDFCKIFISNNPTSIRNHELGQRHKDNVAKKLDSMRKDNIAKEKQQKEAARALEQIEAKANRSYQKDVANLKEASSLRALDIQEDGQEMFKLTQLLMMTEWDYDSTSGYYYNQSNGLHYDPNSGFYYSDAIGKWVTQEEAYAAVQISSGSRNKESSFKKPLPASAVSSVKENKVAAQSGPPPGPVVSASLNPRRSVKGAPSKFAVNKRKRPDEKPKAVSVEEKAALKAREAARKRVEEREKSLLGLYQH